MNFHQRREKSSCSILASHRITEVSVRYEAEIWNGYLGEDAMDIDYEAKYRISVFEPQQNGDIKTLYYSNTNSETGTIGSGETFLWA